jgi:hypothetical protein
MAITRTMFLEFSKATAVLAFLVCCEHVAHAAERSIARGSVPAAVITALAGEYPKWSALGFVEEHEHGRTVYEASLGRGAERLEVDVTPQGVVLGEEAVIDLARTPTAVRDAFVRSQVAKGRVLRVERAISFPEKRVQFEIDVKVGARTVELAYDATGRLLSRENAGNR